MLSNASRAIATRQREAGVARQRQGTPDTGISRRWAGIAGLVLLAAVSLWGLGTTQGATIAAPGLSATVTSSVSPTRLPKTGGAPVTFAATGTLTATDGLLHPVRAIELRLDRQLDIDTTGRATCAPGKLSGLAIQQARQRCGKALVGSGHLTEEFDFLGEQRFTRPAELLFFNVAGGGLLVYTYLPRGAYGGLEVTASMTAHGTVTGRTLQFPLPDKGDGGATVAFQFRFGKTWRYQGKERSYLNGSCVTGTFKNSITMTLDSGTVSETVPQRCMRRG
jgi:hypothetical protein